MTLPTLRLKPHEERRLRAGHLWVYSNEIDAAKTPLKTLEPGTLCRLEDARGGALGTATVNPHALLCGRLLTRRADATIDREWFLRRLRAAMASRDGLYDRPFYRLVYGEGDGLPGLVVDRFGDVLVVQMATAGMERLKGEIVDALQTLCAPRGIWLRNDVPMRTAEGLPTYTEAVGDVPAEVEVDEGGTRFLAPVRDGQKTGWFYDQRDNRDRMARYVRGARVLDVYSYVGAWALRALGQGATSATCVDASAPALEMASRNAGLNGQSLECRQGDAPDVMKALHDEGRRFDVVVVDPPALIKRKKDHAAGAAHYERLQRAALALLEPNGVLVSASCSFHLEVAELQRAVLRGARADGRRLAILEQGGQGPDHPVHPAIPETRYLKAFFSRVAAE